jgi:enoyl-CoA hydratase/carnithine racemase
MSVVQRPFAHARLVTLTRPTALNSIDAAMTDALVHLYRGLSTASTAPRGAAASAAAPPVIVLKGAIPRAFSAGGAVDADAESYSAAFKAFDAQHLMVHHIAKMRNAQVALWDGIAIGAGVGISAHGSHRVCTETTMLSLPETRIGILPGMRMASDFLQKLPHAGLGLFLALTSASLRGGDVLHAGLATHYVPSAKVAALEARLCAIDLGAAAGLAPEAADAAVRAAVDAVLAGFHEPPPAPFTLAPHLDTIAAAFAKPPGADGCPFPESVGAIVAALQARAESSALSAEQRAWCVDVLATIGLMSPLAMTVLLASVKTSRPLALAGETDAVLAHEFQMLTGLAASGEFARGVQTVLVERRRGERPDWHPATLADVSPFAVERLMDPTRTDRWLPR